MILGITQKHAITRFFKSSGKIVQKIGSSKDWNQGITEKYTILQQQQNIPDAYLEPRWTSAMEFFSH